MRCACCVPKSFVMTVVCAAGAHGNVVPGDPAVPAAAWRRRPAWFAAPVTSACDAASSSGKYALSGRMHSEMFDGPACRFAVSDLAPREIRPEIAGRR